MKRLVRTFTCVCALAALTFWPAAEAHAQAAASECPRVEVSRPDDAPGSPTAVFRVEGVREGERNFISYRWMVSAGDIASGQGTPSITVDLTGVLTSGTEVSVELGGLRGKCDAVATSQLPPVPFACGMALDTYGNIRFEDEQARLDNFAIELMNDPTARGYIIAYGGRRGRAGEAQRRADRAKNYMVSTRGIPADSIMTMDGGFREDLTVELRIVPAGVSPPASVPTVDPAEVEIIPDAPEPKDPSGRKRGRGARRPKTF